MNQVSFKSSLIAPCGMNCGVCMAYLREKRKCPGCRGSNENKFSRVHCRIKNCDELTKKNNKFCFMCKKFPCARLKQLDKRYRTKYSMSMLENLEHIKKLGVRAFVKNEIARWSCPHCGGVICVHRGYCYKCGEQKKA